MSQLFYKQRPISTISALARALSIDVATLRRIAAKASIYYRIADEIEKPDGSVRTVFSVLDPLKRIQKNIKKRLLDRVNYPVYLQGGIKDSDNPRDYVRNAGIHSGCVALINEDISNFFPSISRSTVLNIWKYFFNFSDEVAEVLTALTVKDGGLAQGASTSCHLANLVFWKSEPRLVELLKAQGMTFSRFVDDISVSSTISIRPEQKAEVVSLIRRMASRNGLRLKAKKHRIFGPGESMHVNNLVVNKKVSLKQVERSRIRAAVLQCEILAKEDIESVVYRKLMRSTKGRVAHLKRFHPRQAKQLEIRLASLPT